MQGQDQLNLPPCLRFWRALAVALRAAPEIDETEAVLFAEDFSRFFLLLQNLFLQLGQSYHQNCIRRVF